MADDKTTATAEAVLTDDKTVDTSKTTETTDKTTTDDKAGYWAADWRERLAGGDEKARKQLERYASPEDIWKKSRALESKLSSGEYKAVSPFPNEGTDDEKAAWRKERGIPDKSDAYLEKLPEGLVIGEADKANVSKFVERMHGKNAPPEHVHEAIAAYYEIQEGALAEITDTDAKHKESTEEELRSEWGVEYKTELTRIKNFLAGAPENIRDSLLSARMPPREGEKVGRPWASDPDVLRWLNSLAREMNPGASVVPTDGRNQASAIEDELAGYRKMMADNPKEYWSDKVQKRERELLDAQMKLQKKAA
jgi:hypothetical protein